MKEYYFLFALGLVWTLFAVIQDFKTKEVANWLNFSLIGFALSYRGFYSIILRDYDFFLLGILGFVLFFALAYGFYYAKVFAGGDAKLLMGYGAILPFENYSNLFSLTIFFLFFLFLVGAVYSLAYSISIVLKNKKKFKQKFSHFYKKYEKMIIIPTIIGIALIVLTFHPLMLLAGIILLIPLLYIYTKALDKCMIVLLPPEKLTEGDWLEKNIKINSKITIKKTVHGLSLEDIKLLKKHKKKVLVKQGIPFTPAFFLTLIVTIYLSLKLFNFLSLLNF